MNRLNDEVSQYVARVFTGLCEAAARVIASTRIMDYDTDDGVVQAAIDVMNKLAQDMGAAISAGAPYKHPDHDMPRVVCRVIGQALIEASKEPT